VLQSRNDYYNDDSICACRNISDSLDWIIAHTHHSCRLVMTSVPIQWVVHCWFTPDVKPVLGQFLEKVWVADILDIKEVSYNPKSCWWPNFSYRIWLQQDFSFISLSAAYIGLILNRLLLLRSNVICTVCKVCYSLSAGQMWPDISHRLEQIVTYDTWPLVL